MQQQGSAEAATSSQASFDATPYIMKLRALVPNSPPSEQLRDAVRLFSNRLEEVEIQGTASRYIVVAKSSVHTCLPSYKHPRESPPALSSIDAPPHRSWPRPSNNTRGSHRAYPALPPVHLPWTLGLRLGRSQRRTRGVRAHRPTALAFRRLRR